MELTALIYGCHLVPLGKDTNIYTDSELCVNIITKWAERWKNQGWVRHKKGKGEIKNLDLVQELFTIFKSRSELHLQWIKGHSGNRWNEYADSLATTYKRSIL
jgi:ribonuclease HI